MDKLFGVGYAVPDRRLAELASTLGYELQLPPYELPLRPWPKR
jgi:hypothetical protein